MADAARYEFGTAHMVMHNAGAAVFCLTQEMLQTDWLWTVNCVQAFVPRMIAQGDGGAMST